MSNFKSEGDNRRVTTQIYDRTFAAEWRSRSGMTEILCMKVSDIAQTAGNRRHHQN